MQSSEGAQIKKRNGLSIAYAESLNFARGWWARFKSVISLNKDDNTLY